MFAVPGLNNSIQESAFMKSFSISHVISLTLGLVAASLSFSSSVSADGTMECWGAGGTNTGYFPNYGQSMLPTPVPIATNIAAGWTHSMAILSTGNVSAWGSNINNFGTVVNQSVVPGTLGTCTAISAGFYHSMALKTNSVVVCWGDNQYGQCVVPTTLGNCVAVAAGGYHSIAIKSTGLVACWGAGTTFGGVIPHLGQSIVPSTLGTCTKVAGGGYHSVAIKTDGTVTCWGSNQYGQCAVPTTLGVCTQIAAGDVHTVALKSNGTVACFGGGTTTTQNFPEYGQSIVPATLGTCVAIAAGGYHTLVVKTNNSIAAWGSGSSLPITEQDAGQSMVPVSLTQAYSSVAVAAGGRHSMALTHVRYVPSQYATIQSAIDASAPFDTVQVAAGTYAGPIDFVGKNIVVRGASAATTILSGTAGQTSSVVRMMHAEPATARLENFTITGGLTGSPVPGNKSARAGGGVFMYQSAASISSCIIQNNGASFGAGIYLLYCSGVVENCAIRNNSGDAYGGGGLLFDCSTIVRNCEITGNNTVTAGGGLHIVQVSNSNFAPQIVNCSIMNNSTIDRGGGISWQGGLATMQIVDSNIAANAAPLAGGGIYIYPTGGANRTNLVSTDVCSNSYPNITGDYTLDSASHICDCAGDINSDHQIDGIDLAILLSTWGTDGGAYYPKADTNSDGVVNGLDMTSLLSGWGSCASQYGPAWATVLEWTPNPAVVTNATLRNAIVASGSPWRVRDNGTNIEMLLVPAGTFTMGCSASTQYGCNSDENPTHQVTLSAFYIGRYEVTQAQWLAKMGSNPSYFSGSSDSPSRPVERVSWNMIASGSTSFMSLTGLRLPTEAEWEYAYRAGTTTAFHSYPAQPTGFNDDTLLGIIAWYGSNSGNQTHAVGSKYANGFGLHDMSGNVSEWCQDWYSDSYYASSPATNPTGPTTGTYRLLRGGYWGYNSGSCRTSWRLPLPPSYSSDSGGVGFRAARNP